MFNGMFNEGGYGDNNGYGDKNGCGGCGGGISFGGCNCTWILLIILFLSCCGGKLKNFSLNVNPCCLILLTALLFCTGGISIGPGCNK